MTKSANNQAPQEIFDAALRHHQAGNLSEAEKLYEDILKRAPLHADSLHLSGIIAAQKGKSDKALDLIGQAIKLNNDMPFYQNSLGKLLTDLGRPDEALPHLERAITLLPSYVDAHNNLGTLFFTQHKFDKAKEQFERTLALQPDYADAHNNLGGFFLLRGDIEKAETYYGRAQVLSPNSSDTYYNLAIVRFMKRPVEQWGDLCREVLSYKPLSDMHKFDVLVRLAIHYWATDDVANMIEALKASQVFPWATTPSRDKRVYNMQAYRNILINLINFYISAPYQPRPYEQKAAIIGDSHCLAYTNTFLDIKTVPHKIVPHFVMGCKAWHFAQASPNSYKWTFRTILDRLPPRAKCLMSVGEIDCRPEEGIIGHYKKYGGDLDDMIAKTARPYVRYVSEAMRKRAFDVILTNVPAPNIEELRKYNIAATPEDAERLVYVIRAFNDQLAREANECNLPLIDLYRLTVGSDGRSDGKHNTDGYHLKPYALAMAIGSCLDAVNKGGSLRRKL
jgi:tetratricopeptide (TPR) repeat protein